MKQKAAMITLLCVAVCIFLSTASVFAGGIPEEGADGNAAGLSGSFRKMLPGVTVPKRTKDLPYWS